ncbi:MAG: hypothetical protein AAF598_19190 [Bacteroidota bacterium]
MKLAVQRIEEKIKSGYRVQYSENLRESWYIFSQHPLLFIFAMGLMSMFFGFISAALDAGLSMILFFLMAPGLFLGFILASDRISKKQDLQIQHFFQGLGRGSGKYYLFGFLFGLLTLVMGMVLFLFIVLLNPPYILENIVVVLVFGLNVYLLISCIYVIPMLYFFEVKFLEAIMLSWRLTNRQLLSLFFLILIFGVFTIAGFVSLIGSIIILPLISIMVYTTFVEILELDLAFDLDIMDHLVD